MSIKTKRAIIFPVGPSIAYVPLTQGKFSLIDSDDIGLLGAFNWSANRNKSTGGFYARRGQRRGQKGTKTIPMHSSVCVARDGCAVDHRNGNTLDNRRENLREADRIQNARNSRISSRNSSGFKGVYASGSKYQAQIKANGKQIYLGTYDTAEAANEIRKNAAAIHHGEFARTA